MITEANASSKKIAAIGDKSNPPAWGRTFLNLPSNGSVITIKNCTIWYSRELGIQLDKTLNRIIIE